MTASDIPCPKCNRLEIILNSSSEPFCRLCGWSQIPDINPLIKLDHMTLSAENLRLLELGRHPGFKLHPMSHHGPKRAKPHNGESSHD